MTSQTAVSTLLLPIRFDKETAIKGLIFVVVVLVIFPLLAFYLFQMGDLVRKSYLIKNHEQGLREITSQNFILQSGANNVVSLESMEEKVKGLNFVEVSGIKYIPISSDYLVKE